MSLSSELYKKLIDRVKASPEQFKAENPAFSDPIPANALTASGSGLDPHISPATAKAQVSRVAGARGVDSAQIQQVVDQVTEGRSLGFLGEPRVNVLALNLALDPVAIADGDHEEMIFRTQTEQMTRQIPGAHLILLRDVSHFAPFQDPAQFNEAVHNFLEARDCPSRLRVGQRHRARYGINSPRLLQQRWPS